MANTARADEKLPGAFEQFTRDFPEVFKGYEEAYNNTLAIAERVQVDLERGAEVLLGDAGATEEQLQMAHDEMPGW